MIFNHGWTRMNTDSKDGFAFSFLASPVKLIETRRNKEIILKW